MAGSADGTVTALLVATVHGDDGARDRLWACVYDELRSMAAALLAREAKDHVLQPTALVNEAYVRLLGGEELQQQNRAYFYGAAAQAMRRILIEHARRVSHRTRSNNAASEVLDQLVIRDRDGLPDGVDELDRALDELASHDRQVYDAVMLRFFAGLTIDETAMALAVSARTVKRRWTYGRTWLYRRIECPS